MFWKHLKKLLPFVTDVWQEMFVNPVCHIHAPAMCSGASINPSCVCFLASLSAVWSLDSSQHVCNCTLTTCSVWKLKNWTGDRMKWRWLSYQTCGMRQDWAVRGGLVVVVSLVIGLLSFNVETVYFTFYSSVKTFWICPEHNIFSSMFTSFIVLTKCTIDIHFKKYKVHEKMSRFWVVHCCHLYFCLFLSLQRASVIFFGLCHFFSCHLLLNMSLLLVSLAAGWTCTETRFAVVVEHNKKQQSS